MKSTIFKYSVIFLDFNLQSNREFLNNKALKMTFGRGPLLLQKYMYIIRPKRRKKNKYIDFESTWYRNREGLNIPR